MWKVDISQYMVELRDKPTGVVAWEVVNPRTGNNHIYPTKKSALRVVGLWYGTRIKALRENIASCAHTRVVDASIGAETFYGGSVNDNVKECLRCLECGGVNE